MAQEMDNRLLDLWCNADRLPVPVIRALIEELDEWRRHRRSNSMVHFVGPDPGPLDYPLLEISKASRPSADSARS